MADLTFTSGRRRGMNCCQRVLGFEEFARIGLESDNVLPETGSLGSLASYPNEPSGEVRPIL